MFDLYTKNPYEDFPLSDYECKIEGWNYDSFIFQDLIAEIKPKLIIEVGTWLGASAIQMARACVDNELTDTKILCVDTWLGALEFWTDRNDPTRYGQLNIKNGYPQVYYQFLANVLHTNHQNRIIPFPQTSLIAADYLSKKNIKAQLIYVDGSHTYPDVQRDIFAYQNILSPGGYMFGDDYGTWESVRNAVNDTYRTFLQPNGYQLHIFGNHWRINK